MSDQLVSALVPLLAILVVWVKQSTQHNDNKAEIDALKASMCNQHRTCPNYHAVGPPVV